MPCGCGANRRQQPPGSDRHRHREPPRRLVPARAVPDDRRRPHHPDLDELRSRGLIREGAARHDAVADSLPLRGAEIVFAIDGEARPDTDSPLVEGGRYLISGFIKPAGHRILKAQLSLPHDIPHPTEQYAAQSLPAGPGTARSWRAWPTASAEPAPHH